MAWASLTVCQANVEAQSLSTDGLSLSLNNDQFSFHQLNFWPATPQFTSWSTFGSSLNGFNQDLIIGGVGDNLDMLPGKAGSFGENINFGYQAWKLFSDTQDSLKTISEHPNDPGSDWERASVGLNFYSFFGAGKLLPGAAGGFVTLGDLVKTTAEETRSRVMENRAEGLVYSDGMSLNIQEMRERMSAYEGDFSLRSSHVDADGGWVLDHFSQHPFERDSFSYSWADTRISNLRLNNGSFMSGTFFRDEQNDERGGSLWNFYEPTSVTITRRSQDQYRVTFDGANWNRDFQQTINQEQPFKIPAASIPNIAPPKNLPLPYGDDTKYPPPTYYPIYGEPPKFTPAGIANDDPHRWDPPPIPIIQDPMTRGGVLLHADVTTNAPPTLRGIFGDANQKDKSEK